MGLRRSTSLVAVGAVLCLGGVARAEEPPKVQTTLERTLAKVKERARPEVALYYTRALAPEGYSDFRHSTGMQLALGALIDPAILVRASLSLDRDIGRPVENFRASNTTVSAVKAFGIEKVGTLLPTLFVRLPTNDEDRYYLSYRGALGTNVGLANPRIFTFNGGHTLGALASLTGARNFFEFTTSREGGLSNRLWTVGGNLSLVYGFRQMIFVTASFRNTFFWTAVGRDNDRYDLVGSVQYVAPYGLRFGLSAVTSDRTFQYDQVSLNVNLYRPESTMVVFSVAYTPQFDVLGAPR